MSKADEHAKPFMTRKANSIGFGIAVGSDELEAMTLRVTKSARSAPSYLILWNQCGGRGIEPLPCGASASSIANDSIILLTWGAAPNQAPRNREQHLCPKLCFTLSFDATIHVHLHFHVGFRHHEAS